MAPYDDKVLICLVLTETGDCELGLPRTVFDILYLSSRFAIFLHYHSPRAYEAVRNTGVFQLPNNSTLRDYTRCFEKGENFQLHVF